MGYEKCQQNPRRPPSEHAFTLPTSLAPSSMKTFLTKNSLGKTKRTRAKRHNPPASLQDGLWTNPYAV